MIQKSIVLIMLAACSCQDILHRKILIQWLVYFSIAGILCWMILTKQPVTMLIPGVIPGFAFLIFSFVTHGSIGIGDGILLMALGIYLGAAMTVRIIVYAVFLSAFYALFLYFGKKKGRDYEMPFVPFLLAAFLVDIVFGEW